MKQVQSNTKVAGIDVGKRQLDVAIYGVAEQAVFANTPAGIGALIAWLVERGVGRVGLEASGGYERGVRTAASAAALEVVVHQPAEVRLYARLKAAEIQDRPAGRAADRGGHGPYRRREGRQRPAARGVGRMDDRLRAGA